MKRFLYACALLLGFVLLAGLAAACGDDEGEEAEPAATAVEEATEEEPTEEEAGETVAPGGAAPFDSFHYTVDLEMNVTQPGEEEQSFISGQVEGDFVAPDSHAFSTTFEFAGLSGTQEAVIIGDDAWIREGEGDWLATTASDPNIQDALSLTSADPEFLQDQQFAEDLAALDSEEETRNGVQTRRYHIPKESVETLVDLLGEGFLQDAAGLEEFEMTVWLEEETDMLVRAELTATASPELFGEEAGLSLAEGGSVTISMVVDVSQINDESIEIEPPI